MLEKELIEKNMTVKAKAKLILEMTCLPGVSQFSHEMYVFASDQISYWA